MILSIVFYKRKNMLLYEKNWKLMKNYTFNNVFCENQIIFKKLVRSDKKEKFFYKKNYGKYYFT